MTTTAAPARGTADLCDEHADRVQVCEPIFQAFGGRRAFHGRISTIRCFEDNSRVKEAVEGPGTGQVLVVDGGGSRRRALLGDKLGDAAVRNGWAGVIIHGCIRDSAELGRMDLGIRALGTMPLRSDKRGEGERDVPVRFAGVTFRPGEFVYVDEDGVVVSASALA
ncbi:MAG TPA: ribonuclease E activity regulator RraA [Steroidobacteraceae bacterium]|nr:ribonuclease E activity regulator RraA [Steroidobacteraceae bacterium]